MAKSRRAVPAPKTPKRKPNGKKKRSLWLRIPMWILSGVLILAVLATGGVAYAYATISLPDPNADFKTNTTFVYYGDDQTKLGSFQVQNRQSISYDQMPQTIKDAVVAAENRTFWTDPGVSATGLFRAALGVVGLSPSDVTASGGGSTITQQYIKIMYLTSDATISRKFKEVLLAAKMGQELSKTDILEGYLNTVYYGRGAYGIQAAARAYFKVDASKLKLAQSVALASVLNSPSNLDPANGDKQAADLLERYQYTLNGMVEMGNITAAQRAKIYDKLPKFPKQTRDSQFGGPKGFLLTMVKNELLANGFSETEVSGGGLRVITTFDTKAQAAAVESAQQNALNAAGGDKKLAKQYHPGLASIDNETGGVLALYGGPDFLKNQWNYATRPRPTGSTFKPYALLAGLRDGWTLSDRLNGNSHMVDGKMVHNAGANYGRVTLQNATTHSVNSAFVDLVTELPGGAYDVQEAAIDAGVPEDIYWDLSSRIPLGTSEVSPLYQAAAYSTFANGGVRQTPHVVAKVLDASGNEVYTADTAGEQTIEVEDATDVTYALSKVASDGTGWRAAALGYPVAGKTGSAFYTAANNSQSKMVAAWFVGFTKQVTTAVMYVKGKNGNADLGGSFYGSKYPTMTWLDYMRTAMEGKEQLSFDSATKRVSTQKPTYTRKKKKTTTAPITTPSASATPDPTQSQEPTQSSEPEPTSSATTKPSSSASSKPTASSSSKPTSTDNG